MIAPNERDLADPLSAPTRAERKFLLVSNLILFAVVWGGIVPKEIVISGFKIAEINARALVLMLEAVAIYALAGFLMYSRADLSAWRLLRRQQVEELETKETRALRSKIDDGRLVEAHDDSKAAARAAGRTYDMRGAFEFWLPMIVGVINPIACGLHELWRP